jgi:predicted RNase H-like HicB family nuclease
MVRIEGRTRYRVAVEDIEPDHFVAWVLDLPGCFSPARTDDEALTRVPERIGDYYAWLVDHDPALPRVSGPFEADVVEVLRAHASAERPDYIVNAFFEDDRRPLTYWDIAVGLRLLAWSRQDLLRVVESLPPERVREPLAGQVHGTIAGILEHIAGAENWYLDQLGLSLEWAGLPQDVMGKLERVRAQTRGRLAELISDGRITESQGERWSARKVLRRALWHERDHMEHISRLGSY